MYHCHLTGTMPRIQKLLIYDVFCLMSTYNLTHFNIFNITSTRPLPDIPVGKARWIVCLVLWELWRWWKQGGKLSYSMKQRNNQVWIVLWIFVDKREGAVLIAPRSGESGRFIRNVSREYEVAWKCLWFVKQQLAWHLKTANISKFQAFKQKSSVPQSVGGHGCFCSFAGRGGPRFHHCQPCHASRDWRPMGSPKRLSLGATKRLVKSIQYRNWNIRCYSFNFAVLHARCSLLRAIGWS